MPEARAGGQQGQVWVLDHWVPVPSMPQWPDMLHEVTATPPWSLEGFLSSDTAVHASDIPEGGRLQDPGSCSCCSVLR